jgi:uncharacterized protein
MRYLIIWGIRLYRRIWPQQYCRVCVFRESCSRHVERVAIESGFIAAFRALLKRVRCCRPGYSFQFVPEANRWYMVCADGSRFPESEAASHIVTEFHTMRRQIRLG